MKRWIRFAIAATGGALVYAVVHHPLAVSLTSPLLAGLLTGLVAVLAAPCPIAIPAAIVAVAVGETADSLLGIESWHVEHLFFAAASSGMAAWGVLRALAGNHRNRRAWFGVAGLIIVLLGMVGSTINNIHNPIWMDYSLYQMLQVTPEPYEYGTDEAMYMRTYNLMHDEGLDYYTAAKKARRESRYALDGSDIAGGALSFRLPTGYVLWALFPGPSGLSIIPLVMLIGVFGVLSGYVIAQRLVGTAAGLVAAAGVALFYADIASSQSILHVEPWAASAALGSVATMVIWRTTEPRHDRWLWGSAGLALAAASIREFDVVLIVAGLLSCLVLEPGTRRKAATPWLIALGGFAALYATHWALVSEGAFINRDAGYWLQADLARAVPVLTHGLTTMVAAPVLPLLLAGIAVISVIGLKDRPLRVMLVAGVLIPTAVYSLFGPAADVATVAGDGSVATNTELAGYWGGLRTPFMVVLATLAVPVILRLLGRVTALTPEPLRPRAVARVPVAHAVDHSEGRDGTAGETGRLAGEPAAVPGEA